MIDRPLLRTVYTQPQRPVSDWLSADGCESARDLFEEAIERFEQDRNGIRSLLIREAELTAPWVLLDREKRSRILVKIRETTERLQQSGSSRDNFSFRDSLARELARFTLRQEGGLALRPTYPACPEELTSDRALESGCADCTELSMVYYEIARLAGLNPTFVEFTLDRDGLPFPNLHLGVGLRLDPRDSSVLTVVDLTQGGFDVGHQHWFEISKTTFLAYYHLSRSERPPDALKPDQEEDYRWNELRRALRFDPDNPRVRFAVGNFYLDHQQWEQAIAEYRRATQLNPHYTKAFQNLAIACGRAGEVCEPGGTSP